MANADDVVNGTSLDATDTSAGQHSLVKATDRLFPAFWNQMYDSGLTPWHYSTVHPELEGHIDSLINGRQNVRVLFPLCGMAIGLKWLSDLGHNVTGIEWSEIAIKSFFKDQKISYIREPIPEIEGELFKTDDSQIQIYMCDFYEFNTHRFGLFDAIWDCGSFEAMPIEQRSKYISHILSLMSHSCRYLLATCEYYQKAITGPFPVMNEDIQTMFGASCNIELLSSSRMEDEQLKGQGVDPVIQHIHLLTVKPDKIASDSAP